MMENELKLSDLDTFEKWAAFVQIDRELHEHAYQMAKGAWAMATAQADAKATAGA